VTARARAIAAAAALWALAGAGSADAQVRGFADVGATAFSAAESFETILGSRSGLVLGGGVEAMLPMNLFVNVRASRFRKTGERVFMFEGERFGLGIPATITITPVQFTAGYRHDRGWRVVPYGGGGVGRHQYEETSDFAEGGENVKESSTGYHLLGGAEVRVSRWAAVAGEAEWATVPDALGEDPNGVSSAFDETDLGGATFRLKVVIGR
jgi:opacity protein-like surface antigen